MIVLTALLASWVVGSVQGSRVAYVAVRADKTDYAMGENVTFSLVPLTEDVQFTVSGDYGQSGVYIIRLPDDIDPGTYLDDSNALNNISNHMNGFRPSVAIPEYNSTGEPLKMSWNGTLQAPDAEGRMTWARATAGYYVLYPVYFWMYGHATKFMLDRSSIFHLDGLNVKYNISVDASMCTIRTELSLPEGAEPMSGLFTTVVPNNSVPYNETTNYHNETLELRPGEVTTVTISSYARDPWYGQTSASMSALFISGGTTYAFGFQPTYYYSENGKSEVHYDPY